MLEEIQYESNEKELSSQHNLSRIPKRLSKEVIPEIHLIANVPQISEKEENKEKKRCENKKQEFKMTEEEKIANRKILKNMSTKLNYIRNPRFRNNIKCLLYSNNLFKDILSPENPFVIDPKVVIFREYQLNCVYQMDLKVLNKTQILTSFKFIPPLTENFSIKRVIFPKKDSSLIAPGMHAKIEILFNATALNSFEDELTIIGETFACKVPLRGIRETPALSLDNPMDCGRCLLGDQTSMVFRCKNNGGDAHFKFVTVENILNEEYFNANNTQNLHTQIENEVFNIGPFSIFPQEFYLYKGMPIEIFINFNPKLQGVIEKDLIICCDSKINLNYKVKAEGISVDMKLVNLDGLGLSESEGKLENLFFDDTYPYTTSERTLKIFNDSPVPVKFHWNIYDKDLVNAYTSEDEEVFFCINPEEGTFQPKQAITFKIIFNPKNSKIYEQKLDLVIEDIPFQAINKFPNNHHFKTLGHMNNFTKGEPFLLGSNSPYPSYPIFSFNLKGRGSIPYLEVDNNYIDFGTVYINQTVEKKFVVNNPKTGVINFKLKNMMQFIHPIKSNYQKINNFFINSVNDFPRNSLLNSQNHLIKMHFDQHKTIHQYTDFEQKDTMINSLRNSLTTIIEENYKHIIDYGNEKISLVNCIKVNFLKIFTQAKNLFTGYKKETRTSENFNKKKSAIMKILGRSFKKNSKGPRLPNGKTNFAHSFFKNALNYETDLEESSIISVEKENTAEFNLKLTPTSLGVYKSCIIFEPEDGIPFSIEMKANVVGPKIKLDIPSIELGLFPISEIKTAKFKIINISPIPVKFLIKESRYKNVNFTNYQETAYKSEVEGIITDKKYRKKISNLKDFFNRSLDKMDLNVTDSHQLMFSTVTDIIEPNKEKLINISFMSPYPKSFRDTLEIMIEHSDPYYININADCEEAFGYLDTTLITPKEIFVTVPLQFKNNKLNIINPTNIPLHFKWEEVSHEKFKAVFTPREGVVLPRSHQEINFEFTFFSIRELDILFKCFVEEMEVPLGVVVKGKVTGLDIAYEMSDELLEQYINTKTSGTSYLKITTESLRSSLGRNSGYIGNNFIIDKSLTVIDLKNIKVNKPHHFSFKIKNISGINTLFNIYCKNFSINKNNLSTNNKDINMNNTGSTSSFSKIDTLNSLKLSKRSLQKKIKKDAISHRMLSDAHEEINFTSPRGNEFNRMKINEKESEVYLSNQKGVAIRIDPMNGKLDANSEVLVNVSVFNESVGNFTDELICEIKGLSPKHFPINLKIRGNPVQLCPFLPGVNYVSDPPVMKMGHVLTNVNKIEKNLKLVNTGFNPLCIDWKVYDYADIVNPKRDVVNIKIVENRQKFSLIFNPLPPRELPEDKQSFQVFPTNATINPKSVKDFTIIFHANNPGLNSALIVAHPRLEEKDKEDLTSIKMSELAVKVDAYGVIPELVVDKKKNLEGLFVYKFYCHSYGISPRPRRSIVLINKQRINIIVRIKMEGPFKIIKTEPVEATIGDMHFNIIPNSNLKLEVKFLPPNPSNEKEWPMRMIYEKNGKITVFFENNEFSEYFLTGILKRPRLKISTTGNESIEGSNVIDFGYVNCESAKRMVFFIMNETDVETKWNIYSVKSKPRNYYGHGTMTKDEKEDMDKNDDPDVFIFNITSGIIYGPSNLLIDIPKGPALPKVNNKKDEIFNPVRVDIIFKPVKNVFYKTKYRLVSETGNSLEFVLKGYGSYFEEHIENTRIQINK